MPSRTSGKSDLLRIWIPMVAEACMLIGLFGGVEIQGSRQPFLQQRRRHPKTAAPPRASKEPQTDGVSGASPKPKQHTQQKVRAETGRER